jgi:DNA-binding MarR family transcriptional regulator
MAKKRIKKTNLQTTTEKELDTIKRLLMLFLIKTGASLSELALALKMDQADISRMIPIRKIKKYED